MYDMRSTKNLQADMFKSKSGKEITETPAFANLMAGQDKAKDVTKKVSADQASKGYKSSAVGTLVLGENIKQLTDALAELGGKVAAVVKSDNLSEGLKRGGLWVGDFYINAMNTLVDLVVLKNSNVINKPGAATTMREWITGTTDKATIHAAKTTAYAHGAAVTTEVDANDVLFINIDGAGVPTISLAGTTGFEVGDIVTADAGGLTVIRNADIEEDLVISPNLTAVVKAMGAVYAQAKWGTAGAIGGFLSETVSSILGFANAPDLTVKGSLTL